MGIYDREYYRSGGSSLLGAWAGSGKVCLWLVGLHVAVFLVQLATLPGQGAADDLPPQASLGPVTQWLAMEPRAVFQQGQVWRLVTACFLHSPASYLHILFNMLFLWVFGRMLEDLYGGWEFLSFYLAAGIAGNVVWGITALAWPAGPGAVLALGASGAVMGLVVLAALIFPQRTILVWWVLPVPLWAFALVYVLGDVFVFLGGREVGVAVAAHLGGAAFALAYRKLGWHLSGTVRALLAWSSRRKIPARQQAVLPAGGADAAIDEHLEAKADAILEKIHRLGSHSLTDEEREILRRASEQYRKRRLV
jgi:membrane associated rhomboid family serine protease